MLESERKHIEEYGEGKFHKVLVICNMVVRDDRRFIGLDKIRSQIAFQSALAATGYKRQHLQLSKECGRPVEETMRAADELFGKAVAAAKA